LIYQPYKYLEDWWLEECTSYQPYDKVYLLPLRKHKWSILIDETNEELELNEWKGIFKQVWCLNMDDLMCVNITFSIIMLTQISHS